VRRALCGSQERLRCIAEHVGLLASHHCRLPLLSSWVLCLARFFSIFGKASHTLCRLSPCSDLRLRDFVPVTEAY
jgi:hypothetical protein